MDAATAVENGFPEVPLKLTVQSKVTSLAGEAVAGGLFWLPCTRVGAQDEDLQPSAAKTNLGA